MKQTIALILTLAAVAMAQTPPGAGLAIGEKLKQNSEALKLYTHKRRTEIKVKDHSRGGARVDLIRYIDGKMETVPLERPARPEQSGRRGGLRGKIIEKKKEEMKDDFERLTALLQQYTSPGSGAMKTLFEKAVISRTGPAPDAGVKVSATGLANPSDSFTLVWSVADKRPVKIEIGAKLDDKPIRVTVEYAGVPNGPFYPARTVISAPKKDLTINIDTFDYVLAEAK